MNKIRTFLLLMLISLIVTFSIQLTEKISQQLPIQGKKDGSTTIDYSIEDFTLTNMDQNGDAQYHLSASSMLHYQESDKTDLIQPQIELFNPPDEHWQIQALRGNVTPRGTEVLLSGQVSLTRTVKNRRKPFTITTESLLIKPDRNTISTQDYIVFKAEAYSIRAKGMLADLDRETIQLHAKIKGSYVPLH